MARIIKVLVADEHPLIQDGVKMILERQPGKAAIINAYSYTQAVNIISKESDIDLALFDSMLPDIKSFSWLHGIICKLDPTPVIVLSSSDDPVAMRTALYAGASGFIHKSASIEIMEQTINKVLSGKFYAPDNAESDVITTCKPSSTMIPARTGAINLSKRQVEVLELVIKGKTNKEIGQVLSISSTTARAHISAIFRELNVKNRTQACYVAAQIGLWPESSKPI